MKIIFISDLHLSPNTKEANQVFYKLLEYWKGNIDALYILGDFFDYWLGDDDNNEFIQEIKLNLKEFSKSTLVYFKGGNHDFAVGRRFAKETGINLIKDMHTIQVGTNTILLSHGDTFCTLDIAYQKMKKILQNPVTIFIGKLLPLRTRYKIKEMLEHKSGEQTNTKPQHIYHVVDETIIQYAHKAGANIVIHGHTHNPGEYSILLANGNKLKRFEIPDWQDHLAGGYIQLEDESIKIIQQI